MDVQGVLTGVSAFMLQQESLSDKGLFAVGAFVWFDAWGKFNKI